MITEKEIKELAKLAKLEIPEERFGEFYGSFSEIIEFADEINGTVAGDNAAIREVPAGAVNLDGLRRDEVKESLPAEKITSNVQSENGYFPVRRVVK